MKIKTDVVTGFLDSGKTTFLRKLLAEVKDKYKKIVVLQLEQGEEELKETVSPNIKVIPVNPKEAYEAEAFLQMIKEQEPDYLLIEQNGMQSVDKLLQILESSRLSRELELQRIYNIIDASAFKLYLNSYSDRVLDQLANSSCVVLNKGDELKEEGLKNITDSIHTLNPDVKIYRYNRAREELVLLADEVQKEAQGKNRDWLKSGITALCLLIIGLLIFKRGSGGADYQVFVTVFISILVQAAPFILLGVVVSSIIQTFVNEQLISRLFPRNGFAGMLAGILLGAAFPVCDCAVVPVASRLIRKGVPVSAAISFMLASPIVNPVVIAATYYAFPNDPSVVFWRVGLGVLVSLLVGTVFLLRPEQRSRILQDQVKESNCSCGYCSRDNQKSGLLNKISFVFAHSGFEFVQTIKYLIIGAFLSTFMQFNISQDTLIGFGKSQSILPLLVMMGAAFVLSICSTSDAFIARTFVGKFSMTPIMGFLVLGPMIDVKNMMMLFGNFKPKFVVKLVGSLLFISFVLLYVCRFFIG